MSPYRWIIICHSEAADYSTNTIISTQNTSNSDFLSPCKGSSIVCSLSLSEIVIICLVIDSKEGFSIICKVHRNIDIIAAVWCQCICDGSWWHLTARIIIPVLERKTCRTLLIKYSYYSSRWCVLIASILDNKIEKYVESVPETPNLSISIQSVDDIQPKLIVWYQKPIDISFFTIRSADQFPNYRLWIDLRHVSPRFQEIRNYD